MAFMDSNFYSLEEIWIKLLEYKFLSYPIPKAIVEEWEKVK